jgi:hypothetical protein
MVANTLALYLDGPWLKSPCIVNECFHGFPLALAGKYQNSAWVITWWAPVESSELLMALASIVVLSFQSCRDQRPNLCSFQDSLCLEMWSFLRREEGLVFLSGPHVSCTVVSHGCTCTQVASRWGRLNTTDALSLYYNKHFLCKIYTVHLSMQASAEDYALTYFTTPKTQSVTWTVTMGSFHNPSFGLSQNRPTMWRCINHSSQKRR